MLLAPPVAAEPDIDTSRLEELEDGLASLEDDVAERREAVGELDRRTDELRGAEAVAQERLEELEAEMSLAVEEYNTAVVALEDVRARLSATRDELAAVSDDVADLEGAVGDHARRLHKLGPSVELSTFLGSDGAVDVGFRSTSLRRILDGEQADLEALSAVRAQVTALETRLADEESEADAAAELVESELAAVEATHRRNADELDELTAVLADTEQAHAAQRAALADDEEALRAQHDAIDDERQRIADERAAIERRQAEAEAEAEAQAQAEAEAEERRRQQAAQSPTNSGGASSGGSSGGGTNGGASGSPSGGGSEQSTSPAPRRSAQVAVDTALAQVGKPYRWGANGPDAFDCSGLTSYAWRAAGVTIPRTSGAQLSGLRNVSRAQLQPGDLVFYNRPVSHVAMYVGGDTIVEASRSGIPVRTASLSARTPVGYARP